MTLPSNLSTTEPAAIPSDPFACLGGAPAHADGAAPQGASFDRVLSQADDARPLVPPTSLAANPPAMYPGLAYINLQVGNAAQIGTEEAISGKTEVLSQCTSEGTEGEGLNDLDEPAEPTVDMALVYQLIAGQWVPQPVVSPTNPAQAKTGEESGLGGPSSQLTAGLSGEPNGSKSKQSQLTTTSTPQQPFSSDANSGKKIEEALGQTASAKDATTATPVEAVTPSANLAQAADIRTLGSTRENIADLRAIRGPETTSGVNPSKDDEEKKTLIVEGKKVNSTGRQVGTRVANREFSMPYSAVNKPVSAEFTTTPSVSLAGGVQAGTTAKVEAPEAAITVQAPRLVEEIRAIADRISVIDRNSVEVRFDFNDTDRLSVRVEYRDGAVHTTFRTDSSQLRDVISHEWQAQAVAADQRSYRVADPVFSSPDATQKGFASLGDGSNRQRAFEQPAQSAAPSFAATGRNAGSTTTAAAPSPAARLETSRHLHTFA